MHPSPDILRSTVIGCEAKYELTRKGLKEELFVLKSMRLVKKRVIIRVIHAIHVYQISETVERQTK